MTHTVAAVPEVGAEIPRVLQALEGVGLVAGASSSTFPADAAQAALRDGAIDLLLVPGTVGDHLDPGVWAAATLSRGEPGDVLVPREPSDQTLQSLAPGSRVAVSGRRRSSFLRVHRRDIEPVPLPPGRSPVHLLEDPSVDAAVLSLTEARRLGLSSRTTESLDLRSWVPTPAQGITVVLCRPADREARRALAYLDDGVAQAALQAERAAGRSLGLGPDATAGVVALPQGRWMRIFGMVASSDGRRMARGDVTSTAEGPAAAGRTLAELLLARGAASLLPGEAA